ncbi:MAG TPA: MmcQ/YjbR family DNA-binding protein [Gemmatimonadales bacterium]|nr:MmcQ/YjbR family DNA-binding protein [Gemmatimonadales bacterium]
MTAAAFRKIALRLPGAEEREHMGHPDFRVKGKIFATLGYPRTGWAAVMLRPEDQDSFVRMQPKAFHPVKGKWGEQGATNIELRHATAAAVTAALSAAHETRVVRAPKRA